MRAETLRAAAAVIGPLMVTVLLAQPAWAQPSREDIYKELRVDQVPADYVVLVDTSGSMDAGDLYSGVRETLGAFLAGLSPSDHVSLYTFDSKVTPRYVGSAADSKRILAAVPPSPTPFGGTDIGAAIASALGELERTGAAPVASVVLITDGMHDPPSGSAYPGTSGAPWDALTQRAAKLTGRVTGYALSLRGQTGAGLLGTVIKSTTVLDPTSIGQLAEYLDRAKAGTRLEKARTKLAADAGKGVTATWQVPDTVDLSGGRASVSLTLRADTTIVPITLTGVTVGSGDGTVLAGDLPSTVDLVPGRERTFDLTLSWDPQTGPIPFRRTLNAAPALTVTGTVGSPWAAPLAPDIDLKLRPTIDGAARQVSSSLTVGTWAAQIIAAALVLALIVAAWILIYLLVRAPQAGTLVAIGGDNTELAHFPLRGRSTRLRSRQLPGRGKVIARRVGRSYENLEGVEYTVIYRRQQHRSRSRFPSGGSTMVGGIFFEHRLPRPSAPIPPPEAVPPAVAWQAGG